MEHFELKIKHTCTRIVNEHQSDGYIWEAEIHNPKTERTFNVYLVWSPYNYYTAEITDNKFGRLSRMKIGYSNYKNNLRYIIVALWNIICNEDYSYYHGRFEQYELTPSYAQKIRPRKTLK